MTDYTAHLELPDAPVGALFQNLVLETDSVTCSTVRSGNGTWLSFGVDADSDDEATMLVSVVRHRVSKMDIPPGLIPEGYDGSVAGGFEHTPLIITSGRTVIHSEGV